MKSFKKLFSAAVVASLFSVVSTSVPAASVEIDNFTTSQGPIGVTTAVNTGDPYVSSGWNSVTTTGDDILGGVRELNIIKTFGTASQGISVNVSNSQLNYSVDSLAKGIGYLRWDGVADNAVSFGLNQDISDKKDLRLNVDFSDNGYQFTLSLYTNASTFSTFHGTADSVGDTASGAIWQAPHEFVFDLTLFTAPFGDPSTGVGYVTCGGDGCVNLSDVNAIEAIIDPNGKRTALDLSLAGVNLVSEPATAMLSLIGLGGLALRRRGSSSK